MTNNYYVNIKQFTDYTGRTLAVCLWCIIFLCYFAFTFPKFFTTTTATHNLRTTTRKYNQLNIPQNIIQTGLYSSTHWYYTKSWKQLNPNASYYFFNDGEAANFVHKHMPPDIASIYDILPFAVLKADFFRYIATYILGGVYSDIDTECLQPINVWTDNYTNASFIVGVEGDTAIGGAILARKLQLCQWTFAAKPKHPILKRMIDNIKKKTKIFIKSKKDLSTIIMDWTGPGLWTDTIFDYLNETFNVNSSTLSKLNQGRLIGDVYYLPVAAFSPVALSLGAKGRNNKEALVYHDFQGSWKPNLIQKFFKLIRSYIL
ncbi:unnamed protein product [Rotaria magnacalcarata]|uniref:Initiation-specific alpha-1,6-mannosyltransferase n=3 Tax=Rotaria magnacalcarata TaxID=392030 RepID=A0A815GNH1_9BILA|nr:unnamed protein product [Rotaria magnacalcarata]CAF1342369.1 unnamed protein product [Rotaria magnacalcarata]